MAQSPLNLLSSSPSLDTSDEGSSRQEEKDAGSLLISPPTEYWFEDPIYEKVTELVRFMILKYRMKEIVTKEEMLKVVIKNYKKRFPLIFKKASKCLEVISGIDVKEVNPTIHSYVLINTLSLTYDDCLNDPNIMPKNGLLTIILGVIIIEGDCAPEESIWDFLDIIGVHVEREHFIYGDPKQLLTRDWVLDNYLEYRQVLNSDPPQYEFLWGPRAYAEIKKKTVMEFLIKIKVIDPISFSFWYEKLLKDEEK
ncbi:melanoma-associated antigen 10-like [Sorex fumeus]|uniref:melanoma-associated antigen 10-like n=1 Tax=Sorex fumeus TaxID=62283 RepID=UPI0024ACB2F3|nr:melanoma-associated antigen 10-like [Sorex fumeus]XP_055986306.1 melanoma-associated antigen 10-like [Sorex fumeus]